jgi:flagellar basal-body rod modification protein FlgD
MDPVDTTSTDPTSGLGTSLTPAGTGNLAKTLGKDDFLKLLMAQIQYQDPMAPMADHEFVAQLATFSSLEQQMLSNDRLGQLQLGQLSNGNAELAGFIGQEIVAKGNTINIGTGAVTPIPAQLEADAAKVTVTVRDSEGKVVSTFETGPQKTGAQQLTWSGKDTNGNPLAPGTYTVEMKAEDAEGAEVKVAALSRGVVTGLSFENGYAELLIGTLRVRPADILSVGDAPADPSPDTGSNTNTNSDSTSG